MFDDFKFPIGNVVKHRSSVIRPDLFVVINRVIKQCPGGGISYLYECGDTSEDLSTFAEIEIEAYVAPDKED